MNNNKGQAEIMIFVRLIIVLIGVLLVISGLNTISAAGPILDRLSETTYGGLKISVGLIFTLMGISPQSVTAVIRI